MAKLFLNFLLVSSLLLSSSYAMDDRDDESNFPPKFSIKWNPHEELTATKKDTIEEISHYLNSLRRLIKFFGEELNEDFPLDNLINSNPYWAPQTFFNPDDLESSESLGSDEELKNIEIKCTNIVFTPYQDFLRSLPTEFEKIQNILIDFKKRTNTLGEETNKTRIQQTLEQLEKFYKDIQNKLNSAFPSHSLDE